MSKRVIGAVVSVATVAAVGFLFFTHDGITAARESSCSESMQVKSGNFDVDGYQCGDQSSNTVIVYPKAHGNYPVVVFGHGSRGGMDLGWDALETMAGMGFIVLAPDTQGDGQTCSSYEWEDMILALHTARKHGEDLHPALAKADFSSVGIWGYSMGGKTAPTAASQPGHNIKAMLAMHGSRNADDIDVPAMFTTGSDDQTEPPELIKDEFDSDPNENKVFVNFVDANHLAPMDDDGEETLWGAYFLSCHLTGCSNHCDRIYGDGDDSICNAIEAEDCIVNSDDSSAASQAVLF